MMPDKLKTKPFGILFKILVSVILAVYGIILGFLILYMFYGPSIFTILSRWL